MWLIGHHSGMTKLGPYRGVPLGKQACLCWAHQDYGHAELLLPCPAETKVLEEAQPWLALSATEALAWKHLFCRTCANLGQQLERRAMVKVL